MNLIPAKFRPYLSKTAHFAAVLLLAATVLAQAPAPKVTEDFSGLYSFVREGDTAQITLDELPSKDKPEVPLRGYISRMGEMDSDKDQVLDIWIKAGSTDGERITFSTKTVHGISYEFDGHVHRGDAKEKGKEGYFVIDGTLTEHRLEKDGRPTSRERQITMKSFPNLDE